MGEWAPDWELIVDGRPIPPEYRALIESITVDATLDGADELTIRAVAWSSIDVSHKIIGESIFGLGSSVVVRMGWHSPDGEVHTLQRFRMLREKAIYPDGALPNVALRGLSAEHLLVEYTRARKASPGDLVEDVVIAIADDHGLDTLGIFETGVQLPKGGVKPKGTSDLKYIQGLAFQNDLAPPYVRYDEDKDADVLYMEPTTLGLREPVITFTYNPIVAGSEAIGGNLKSFEASVSLSGVPTEIEITAWDPIQQEFVRVVMEITESGQKTTVQTGDEVVDQPEELKSGSQVRVAVLGTAWANKAKTIRESLYTSTIDTYDGAIEFAERWIRTRNEAFMTARATIKGNARVWVGQIHLFEGLMAQHNGYWEVLGCRHMMSARGYTVDLDLARVISDDAARPQEI